MKLTSIKSQCCGTKNHVIVNRFQYTLLFTFCLD